MKRIGLSITVSLGALILAGLTATFIYPPVITIQNGFRGTGLVDVYNPRQVKRELAANVLPATLPPMAGGAKAGEAYHNVRVLGDVSVGEFTRLMAAITTWVSPQQGCGYCHEAGNFASDTLYTKDVARRMIQMVQHINHDWKSHVANVGVTCYTCHRGQNIPTYTWFVPDPPHARGMVESLTGAALPARVAGLSSLPYDPITPFLTSEADSIRIQSLTALPATTKPNINRSSVKQTEWTYSLMMNFSQSLGVNCTYCHNSRAFEQWGESTPQRASAWYGIRMVRDLNTAYLEPLATVFPANQHGPLGDGPKLYCATCHQGVYKPLFGVSPGNFPELGVGAQTASASGAPK